MMISERETVKAWDRPLKRGETLDLFVLGKWYSSANFPLISI